VLSEKGASANPFLFLGSALMPSLGIESDAACCIRPVHIGSKCSTSTKYTHPDKISELSRVREATSRAALLARELSK
jgi:hypothetical protein